MLFQKALSMKRLRNGDEVFLMVDYESSGYLVVKIVNIKYKEVFLGRLNDIELRSQAARIRFTFEEYIQKTIKALVENHSDNSNFLYSLDEHEDLHKFHWKSIDEEQTIISIGNVIVKKESFEIALTDMLDTISVEMHLMRNTILELNMKVNDTQNQAANALKQLSCAVEMKEKLEKEIYSKFVLVLNEKKRKISELQQKNKHNSHSTIKEFQRKKTKKSIQPLDSDSSIDEIIDEPGPSTSRNDKSLLFLDDNKPLLPTTKNRIRNRKVFVPKKENGKSETLKDSNQPIKNILDNDDESDEFLFENL